MSTPTTSKQSDFMKVYEPLHDGFVRFCSARSYGVIETDDLVQETILVAFEKFETIRDKKALLAFMMRSASNIVASKARRLKFRGYYDEEAFERLKGVAPSADIAADIHILYQSLRKLPNDMREAIELFEIVGFSIKEIAEMQDASESAVKVRLHRARKKLKEELAPVSSLEQVTASLAILIGLGSLS
ncbi:MAG: RNA polymerase sigma factor [Flavobacteriales bacterium]|nr:RNA polymerase sigma factor [Flavobacteriales bacterium]